MLKHEQRAAYARLWGLAVALGWSEASVVVYLREIYVREVSLHGMDYWAGLQVTLVALPSHLVAVEMVRETCTILVLAAVAWLAGRRPVDRAGAFLLTFGIWDLAYYAVLRLVVGWPDTLSAWDILFLIPLPWVAPVWAPITVATLFVAAGSYLFWTSERERHYRWPDIAVLLTSVLLTIAAFLMESRAASDHRLPEQFPAWLFGAGVVLGAVWFLRAERRVPRKRDTRSPWVDVRVQTVSPYRTQVTADRSGVKTATGARSGEQKESNVGRMIWEYTEAKRRLDALVNEAGDLGERFERLAQGLSAHPGRMIVGLPDKFIENPSDWDMVPSHPLPPIERLVALTNEIRERTAMVEECRERLILIGRADLVEQPDVFFH